MTPVKKIMILCLLVTMDTLFTFEDRNQKGIFVIQHDYFLTKRKQKIPPKATLNVIN